MKTQIAKLLPTRSRLLPLLVACSLATVVFAAVAMQLDPQANPVGQQPPPAVSAQLNQPCAHLPVVWELRPVVTGSMTVTPSDVNVVEDVVGHDVVSQSRPV
ncbi:uncharacterized protein N7459_003576 [Penicillium hispanicum]|uniref:uncharacterized protein n=1 Tax=Penicillium hispanicum TaxID=1080232 RepID=UPI00254006D7|nr:uncharacterized protein N7459_003576 [Penicillium hispanicum]KAJ5587811.1 hypothetical protein N7459_003576 [Penicillium hispanicum]